MRTRCIVIFIALFLLICGTAFGQLSTSVTAIQNALQTVSTDFSKTLPAMSTTGLNWSDAYIGGFPHFGVGATLGVVFIPYGPMDEAATAFGFDLDTYIPSAIQMIGMPLPTWCIDGRIGGFVLPFDVGLKVGFLPPDIQLPANLTFDYLLIGGDIRYGILEDLGPVPDVSVGVGVNWLSGSIGMRGVIPSGSIDIPDYNTVTELVVNSGDFNYSWQALTMDLKAQVSKNLVFITLSAGFGATFSIYAEAGGGIESPIQVLDGGAPRDLDATDISTIQGFYPDLNLSGTSFMISDSISGGWSLRGFGGIQFDILIVKIDLNAYYNFLSGSWGGNLNLRAQF